MRRNQRGNNKLLPARHHLHNNYNNLKNKNKFELLEIQ